MYVFANDMTVCYLCADLRKHQSSASLAFVRAKNKGNISILWHHHDMVHFFGYTLFLYPMDIRSPWPHVMPAFRLLHRRTQTSHTVLKCGTNKCSHGSIYWTEILRHWAVTNSVLAPCSISDFSGSTWSRFWMKFNSIYTTTAIYDWH